MWGLGESSLLLCRASTNMQNRPPLHWSIQKRHQVSVIIKLNFNNCQFYCTILNRSHKSAQEALVQKEGSSYVVLSRFRWLMNSMAKQREKQKVPLYIQYLTLMTTTKQWWKNIDFSIIPGQCATATCAFHFKCSLFQGSLPKTPSSLWILTIWFTFRL